jgi:hypothetical protein
VTGYGDGSSGSSLGGFGHADGIEPGALDEKADNDNDNIGNEQDVDSDEADVPTLSDPEGLVDAHDDAHDDAEDEPER